ncbi:hypothetical protein IP68_12550 [Blastomonas sp. AAP25]|uniref:hypothetical protein n=1 Tax=Blastomonas sp. AAP25 TaxID=1523416 RepID=UPI0006B973D3|nr:hypothetical protein [Blastomonas sp. AAP25]KPF74582.1 hypothetical protein IP68_12550 [Blastomonas sp. AAP25]
MQLVPYHDEEKTGLSGQMKWSIGPGFAASFKVGGVKYDNLQKTDKAYKGEWFYVARVFGAEARSKHPAQALAAAALRAQVQP